MEFLMFVSSAVASTYWSKRSQSCENDKSKSSQHQGKISSTEKCYVSADNATILEAPFYNQSDNVWCRATYMLVMHEPPHLFYEPTDWNHTDCLLLKKPKPLSVTKSGDDSYCWGLPGGMVMKGESYHDSAVRRLFEDTNVDVCQPENCLHHLFTFPYEYTDESICGDNVDPEQKQQNKEAQIQCTGVWGDCYECVFRGEIKDLGLPNAVCMTLAELKDLVEKEEGRFEPESRHVLQLYFQRQGDLRAKRRLLKGYSSGDLDHYGLRKTTSGKRPLMMLDSFHDETRNAAMDYTMKTDDGMCPRLLYQADVIILGVSRTGKTPLSIFISQTAGLKVANVPLVFELQPPKELTDENQPVDKKIDPRRIFCLTRDVEEMEKLRLSRIQQALKKSQHKTESTYANFSYIRKDLAKARSFAKEHGFTEIDVTDRALEECASIIISKLKERLPDMHIH